MLDLHFLLSINFCYFPQALKIDNKTPQINALFDFVLSGKFKL